MRTLWSIVCVVAVANLVGGGGFIAWLVGTGRLDAERLTRVRDILRETPAEQSAREEEVALVAAESRTGSSRGEPPPMRSEDLLTLRLAGDAVDQQRLERLRREIADLQQGLRRERAILDEQREQFEGERTAFVAEQARIEELKGSEQFTKSLTILESVKAAEATEILLAMLGAPPVAGGEATGAGTASVTGWSPTDLARVVSYLDAMQDRTRARIVAEVAKDNAALAADLLERLRRHGLAAQAPEIPPG